MDLGILGNEKVQEALIVLSTGRTGTKAMAHYFNVAYDTVTAVHEPKPSRYLRILSNRAVAGKIDRNARVRALAANRRKLFAQLTRPVYLESNWYVYGFLDAMDAVFGKDRTKILHVVRDPRSYIPSHLNYGTISGYKRVFTTLVPYWYLRPEQVNPQARRRWFGMADEERMAWHWHMVNNELDKARALFGDRYRFMKYETLYDKSGKGVDEVCKWVGLPHSDKLVEQVNTQRVHASPNRGYKKFADWDDRVKASVLDLCGEQMKRYGFEA